MKSMIFLIILLTFTTAFGQAKKWKMQERPRLTRRAIVLTIENDYNKAQALAQKAAKELGLEWQERQLSWDRERNTLTLPAEECQARGLGPYPCYLARGVEDWLPYVSVELAMAYDNLPEGRFAVMVALYRELAADQLKEQALILEKARSLYPKTMDLQVGVFTGVISQELDTL